MRVTNKKPFPTFFLLVIFLAAVPFAIADASSPTQKDDVSIIAGRNMVDAVADVRTSIGNLTTTLLNATERFGFGDWEQKEERLRKIERHLLEMKNNIDQKTLETGSSWSRWLASEDYGITIKHQLKVMGNHVAEIARILSETQESPGQEVVVGHEVVNQVDEMREVIGDLLRIISDTGTKWGWFDDRNVFRQELENLERMEKSLDKKADTVDEDWEYTAVDREFPVMLHEKVATLGDIISKVATQMSAQR